MIHEALASTSFLGKPKTVQLDASRALATAGYAAVRPNGYSDKQWHDALADARRLGFGCSTT